MWVSVTLFGLSVQMCLLLVIASPNNNYINIICLTKTWYSVAKAKHVMKINSPIQSMLLLILMGQFTPFMLCFVAPDIFLGEWRGQELLLWQLRLLTPGLEDALLIPLQCLILLAVKIFYIFTFRFLLSHKNKKIRFYRFSNIITSWGTKCGNNQLLPAVFIRVRHFLASHETVFIVLCASCSVVLYLVVFSPLASFCSNVMHVLSYGWNINKLVSIYYLISCNALSSED